MVNTTLKQ